MFKSKPNPPTKIESDLEEAAITALQLQEQIDNLEAQMLQNDLFKAFITKQKAAKAQIQETWDTIEAEMIKYHIKNIKRDWGTLTIANRPNWEIDESKLPEFYFKRVPDTKKIGDAFKLTGKSPNGVKRNVTKYLMKKLK